MAEALISSIAGEIVASLAPQAIENIGKLWGAKHDLEALRERVSTLQALLDDAEEQYYQSHEIKDWVDRLKGAFYDALDMLEEYNVEATRQGLRGHNKMFKEVRKFFSGSNQVAFILKMSYKREWRKRKETHSFACEGDIIGRDDDKETVKKFLLDSDVKGNVSILPIVGIGGLGKTTLAQYVYNDKMVSEHFELKMWVCVSNDFDMENIVKNILACVTEEVLNHDALEQLQNKLRRKIDGRRYLLVLDDYWDDELETWLKLKTLLVGGARGSKILITTRLRSVAEITCTTSPHLLGGLSEMESVNLLMQMAFPKEEETQDLDLRTIGEEIARRCSGVPLVVRTVGSLLFSKKTKAEWLHFKDYKLPEASRSEEEIMSVLRLSYNNLPSHLKRCFAFCSLLPKDHKIDKQTFVDLWVVEGFIKPSNTSEPLEDIAHEYFMNLLSSNFFQDFEKNPLTKRETCKMHDLMHDLACLVVGNECCVVGNDTKSIDARTHHISVGDLPLPFPHLEASRLRTLIFLKGRMISEEDLHPLMQSFKELHVLDLHDTSVKKLPRSICELKYLTYLDLSYNMLNRLPNSIMKLQNLQMLNLDGCRYLEELPRGITKLVSLRNLGIKDCERLSYVPCGLGQLSSLHRLNCFILPKDKARAKNYGKLEELYGLNNIRGSLCIENLGHVTDTIEEYKAANLTGKQSLESLELEWGGFNTDDAIIGTRNEALLDGLQPPSNLRELTITGYEGESFPRWMMDSLVSSFPNLVEVGFKDCRRCKRLSPLGQLPHLKSLQISRLAELEYLEFGHSSTLTASFPNLLKLGIFNCKKLKAMPLTSHLGDNIFGQRVRHLPNLVDLSIKQCDELDLCKDESGDILDFQGLQSLRDVQIRELPKLAYLPQWLVQASNLEHLEILSCGLKALPEQIEAFQSLQRLAIALCHSLTSLPKGINCNELDISKDESGNILDFHGGLPSLRSMSILFLPKLTSLPQWLLQLRSLESLLIYDCPNFKALSKQIEKCEELDISKDQSGNILHFHGGLPSLRSVTIGNLPKLTSLPQWILQARNLERLLIWHCRNLKDIPEQIEALQSLQILDIWGAPR
ncbi:hypothetical protein EUGRSUZ_B00930 [Eucalyptus grandis]|uniref:Uncharacterized protein n=2 Tax=Eucalyptus grandis TaxID=71139 RepID=A0A059CZZ7_EUCGR|nr:hypothetical protein EUGRSUZ_B00930 [Eucalyptus grandis]